MKTFLLLAVSFSIALAQVVNAENQDKIKAQKNRTKVTQTTRHVTPAGPHINRNTVQANQYHPKVQSTARIHTKVDNVTFRKKPPTTTTVQADTSVRNKNWQNKNWQNKNNQNTTLQKKNWKNRTLNSNSWAEARRRHHRDHHDRNWWRSHFTRFALFGSGYYFWDGGYWYPAYGYDSGYNTYDYDEPIYGYNDLDPGQVISSVQTELQRLGYYRNAVDGQMGPATRAAIANYQRDKGLSITSAIDEPTLDSLGLR
ncbi:MAG TPA: peptidoglycan-binding domain-containing protein [Chthoniobacterales bacterium]